jgi:hypothetical protein
MDIGHAAVPLRKYLGAKLSGECSPRFACLDNAEFVQAVDRNSQQRLHRPVDVNAEHLKPWTLRALRGAYSYRSVSIGFTRAALRAGRNPTSVDTAAITMTTATSVKGS